MSMTLHSNTPEPELMLDINTTPLIDVMLVLLIMLIVTIPVQLHAVKLDMPVQIPPTIPMDPKVIRVEVMSDGQIQWNGKILKDRSELRALMSDAAQLRPLPELHIRSHIKAKYASAAHVLSLAQSSGLTQIGIVGTELMAAY